MKNVVFIAVVFLICGVFVVWLIDEYPTYALLGFGVLLAYLTVARLLKNKRDAQRGWRVRRWGRDEIIYEELVHGAWRRIKISGEMQGTNKPSFLVYCTPPDVWKDYPDWARDRRAEIFNRIKIALPEPNYKYVEKG